MVRIRGFGYPAPIAILKEKYRATLVTRRDVSQRSPRALFGELLRHLAHLHCRPFEVFPTEATQNGVQRTESAESHGTTYCILLLVTKKLTY